MVDAVLTDVEDGIRTISLNRPDCLNAMNRSLIEGVRASFAHANRDPETKVIIFTGAGKAFCAGDDLDENPPRGDEPAVRPMVEELQQCTREIVFGPKIVVGAINGWAAGGGLEWAINCDLTLWAESARPFFPEIKLGVSVTGGVTALLPRIVGLVKAREMMLFGAKLGAAELAGMGLAWRVVPDAELMDEARTVAAEIAALPQRPVTEMKRMLARVTMAELETALQVETETAIRGALSPEVADGLRAWQERKRGAS